MLISFLPLLSLPAGDKESSALAAASGASTILVLGDSYAQVSGISLSQFCGGKSVVNRATSGTTARDWADEVKGGKCAWATMTRCSVADALDHHLPSNVSKSSISHIWYSAGMNDFVGLRCMSATPRNSAEEDRKTLAELFGRALDVTVSAIGSLSIKIVMTGYAQVPSDPRARPKLCTAHDLEYVLNGAVSDACNANSRCTYVPITTLLGGSSNAWASGGKQGVGGDSNFAGDDTGHPNNRGFCRIFTHAATQSAFGCSSQKQPDCGKSLCHIVPCGPDLTYNCAVDSGACWFKRESGHTDRSFSPRYPNCEEASADGDLGGADVPAVDPAKRALLPDGPFHSGVFSADQDEPIPDPWGFRCESEEVCV